MGKSKDLASGAAYQDQTESDTRYVNTAGDTMTGNLQSTELVANNAGNNTNIRVQNTASGSGSSDGFVIQNATNSKVYLWNYENSDVLFGTNSIERMKIDGSGRVTKPNQPCFLAVGNAGQTSFSSGAIINIVNEIFDKGSNFDTSNGRFTAPVAGAYFFSYAIYSYDAAKLFSIKINNNDYAPSDTHGLCTAHTTNSMTGTSTILNLAANDYVNVGFRGGHSGSVYINHCHFAGFLIG